jgi:thiamine kinase
MRVPDWEPRDVSITPISGGLTNRSFLVTRGADSFVLRLDAEHTQSFSLDRVREFVVLRRAANAGLAPELIYSDPDARILLCRYLPGHVWGNECIVKPRNLDAVGRLLQKVHALPLCGNTFDASAVASSYARKIRNYADLHYFSGRCTELFWAVESTAEICCCHNDMVAANIIATPKLMLIDWEYACDNNPLFDIASLVGFHDLQDDQARRILVAYAGDDDMWDLLQDQVQLFDALQWLWYAIRQTISPHAEQKTRLDFLQKRLAI